jgi:hypothetical protein
MGIKWLKDPENMVHKKKRKEKKLQSGGGSIYSISMFSAYFPCFIQKI